MKMFKRGFFSDPLEFFVEKTGLFVSIVLYFIDRFFHILFYAKSV